MFSAIDLCFPQPEFTPKQVVKKPDNYFVTNFIASKITIFQTDSVANKLFCDSFLTLSKRYFI